jgi:hypothetical protein
MSNSSNILFEAIPGDDRARMKELLKAALQSATEPVKKGRLALELPHWIYAGDTPLHAAAAEYRVEIAKLLLAAGADISGAG